MPVSILYYLHSFVNSPSTKRQKNNMNYIHHIYVKTEKETKVQNSPIYFADFSIYF